MVSVWGNCTFSDDLFCMKRIRRYLQALSCAFENKLTYTKSFSPSLLQCNQMKISPLNPLSKNWSKSKITSWKIIKKIREWSILRTRKKIFTLSFTLSINELREISWHTYHAPSLCLSSQSHLPPVAAAVETIPQPKQQITPNRKRLQLHQLRTNQQATFQKNRL